MLIVHMPPQDRQPTCTICLSGFWGIHEELFFKPCLFSLPLSFSSTQAPWMEGLCTVFKSDSLRPAEDDAGLDDLWPQNKTESLLGSAAMRTRHCRVSAEICDDEGKRLKLVICIIKLFWENYYSRWLIKQNCQRLWFQLLNYEDLLLFFVTCISRLSLNLPKQTDRQCKHLRMSPQKTTVFHFSFHPPWTKPGDLWLVVFQPNDQQQVWHSKYKLC